MMFTLMYVLAVRLVQSFECFYRLWIIAFRVHAGMPYRGFYV